MTKDEAQMIVDSLSNESAYNVDVKTYGDSHVVEISEKCLYTTSMYLNTKIIEVCHKHQSGICIFAEEMVIGI
jgi:hypothetical protein